MKRIVVTGATGFVGTTLAPMAVRAGQQVLALSSNGDRALHWHRSLPADVREGVRVRLRTDSWSRDPWALGAHALIHLAARVHVMEKAAARQDDVFRAINEGGTRDAFTGASQAGILRFVLVSSVKVQGESSPHGGFNESLPLHPSDAYARSKVQAERAVHTMSAEHGLPFVIVRPPLVYGSGVGGNMAKLVSWIARNRPVPVGGDQTRRSLIGVRNLGDVLLRCAIDPRAEGHTFLVADGEPVTLPELVRAIGAAMDRRGTSIALPEIMQRMLYAVPAARVRMERLSSPLVIDDRFVRRTLEWTPPFTLSEEVRLMVRTGHQSGITA